MASGSVQVTKVLLSEGIITINPADFSASGTGYTARKTIPLNGFYTASPSDPSFTPGTTYLDTSVPDVQVQHRYRFNSSFFSYYRPVPYNDMNSGFTPNITIQSATQTIVVDVVSNVPPITISGTLQIDYYTYSNSSSIAGSAFYAQDFLYKIWSPVFR